LAGDPREMDDLAHAVRSQYCAHFEEQVEGRSNFVLSEFGEAFGAIPSL
jgi:hypothetical protein